MKTTRIVKFLKFCKAPLATSAARLRANAELHFNVKRNHHPDSYIVYYNCQNLRHPLVCVSTHGKISSRIGCRRPKNLYILSIRIQKTVYPTLLVYSTDPFAPYQSY